MVIRFSTSICLSFLLLLTCGHGISVKDLGGANSMKNLEEKQNFFPLYHTGGGANSMKNLEEKQNFFPLYHTDGGANSMKNLEKKQNFFPLYHTGGGANSMKNLEEKQNFFPLYHTGGGANSMKNLEEKQNFFPFYHTGGGTNSMKNLEEKQNFFPLYHTDGGANSMKNLEEKQNFFPFYHTGGGANSMKNLEEKQNFFPLYHTDGGAKMEHQHNVESAEIGLFSMDDLRAFSVGQKLRMFFPIKDHSLYPPFLPKEVADIIPFSSSHASNILQFFSVSPDSPKGKAVQDTLRKCELDAAKGETKICATSFEILHGFLRKAFGPEVDFKFISTSHPTMTTPTLQNYTILEPPREIQSAKKVACHPLPYLYAIYYCHFDATETKTFKLPLVGDSGDKVEALVVCHMDTSGWSSNHIAFRMLGIKHGNSACHVFTQGNLVWIQQPSLIVAM
ncbi:hypothetical protein REPUB_Repub11eG0069200 [Reevesia pubescens]